MSIQEFSNSLESLFQGKDISIGESDDINQIVLDCKYNEEDYEDLEEWNITSRQWGTDQTIVNFSNSTYKVFLTLNDYRQTIKYSHFENDFLILENGTTSIWSNEDEVFSSNLGQESELINSYSLKIFQNYLTDSSNEEQVSHLTTYIDKSSKAILFTSLNGEKNLKVKITYNEIGYNYERIIKKDQNLSCIKNLINKLSNPDFATLLKNNIVKVINVSEEQDLYVIFNKCDYLLKETNNDHKLFVSRFTFESFINELNERKEAYFDRIKNQLQHSNAKLFSLVVSLSALFVGLYNTKDIPTAFASLLVVYYLYAIYIFTTNIFAEKEYLSQKNIFENDYKFIGEKSGIDEEEIARFKRYITNMLSQLNFSIWVVYIIFTGVILLLPFSATTTGIEFQSYNINLGLLMWKPLIGCFITIVVLWVIRFFYVNNNS